MTITNSVVANALAARSARNASDADANKALAKLESAFGALNDALTYATSAKNKGAKTAVKHIKEAKGECGLAINYVTLSTSTLY